MAHIFKYHSAQQKGIVVFTDTELDGSNWKENFSDEEIPILNDVIANKYFVGMHYGSAPRHYSSWRENISFVMASLDQLTFNPDCVPFFIPLNSRNFLPDFFQQTDTTKYWDVLCVSTNAPYKNLNYFVQSIRALYDHEVFVKVLLIAFATSWDELKTDSEYYKIVEDYENNFSMKEKEFFTLMRLSPEYKGMGMSMKTIAHFYNSSKVFAMLSASEGESRVIHEALACGLTVVCFAGLTGGGRDYLSEENSCQFADYNDLPNTLVKAVNRYNAGHRFDTHEVSQHLLAQNTLPILKEYFCDLYSQYNEAFDTADNFVNTDYLNFRLPAHFFESLPWADNNVRVGPTANILSTQQYELFCKELGLF
ncbi:MAG: hypothetical protein CMJ80_00465 [Planctomycetaceae bacterium]|nr:hypothetical protein [Planctomycetaceae bacterium]